MVSTVVIPQGVNVFLSVPPSYIGRQVEVTFSLIDSAEEQKPVMKLSEMLRGAFSKESAEDFIEHTKRMREEW